MSLGAVSSGFTFSFVGMKVLSKNSAKLTGIQAFLSVLLEVCRKTAPGPFLPPANQVSFTQGDPWRAARRGLYHSGLFPESKPDASFSILLSASFTFHTILSFNFFFSPCGATIVVIKQDTNSYLRLVIKLLPTI